MCRIVRPNSPMRPSPCRRAIRMPKSGASRLRAASSPKRNARCIGTKLSRSSRARAGSPLRDHSQSTGAPISCSMSAAPAGAAARIIGIGFTTGSRVSEKNAGVERGEDEGSPPARGRSSRGGFGRTEAVPRCVRRGLNPLRRRHGAKGQESGAALASPVSGGAGLPTPRGWARAKERRVVGRPGAPDRHRGLFPGGLLARLLISLANSSGVRTRRTCVLRPGGEDPVPWSARAWSGSARGHSARRIA